MRCPHCNGSGEITLDGVTVGLLIVAARKASGMRQEDLSSRAGVSRPQIANIESGRSDVPTGTLIAIAAALGVQPGELLPRFPTPAQSEEA